MAYLQVKCGHFPAEWNSHFVLCCVVVHSRIYGDLGDAVNNRPGHDDTTNCNMQWGLPPVTVMEEAMRTEGGYISKSGNGTSMAGCASNRWVQQA
jgi:hypothetical protein